jgi:hypothetical protein
MIRETDQLQPTFLLLAPKRIPDLRLFRRNVIKVHVGDRFVRAGVRGQADLHGYWLGGAGIEIELKAARGRSTPEQIAWATFCQGWGVRHLVLKADARETAEETAERWCREVEVMRPIA